MVAAAYKECQDLIMRAKKGLLENKPGCDQDQTLEAMISSVLSNVREKVGKICMVELSRHNAPYIMATCGSKGTNLRISILSGIFMFLIPAGSSQGLSLTSVRWLPASDNRLSQVIVFPMGSKIAPSLISPRNPASLLQKASCATVSTRVSHLRSFSSTLSPVERVLLTRLSRLPRRVTCSDD